MDISERIIKIKTIVKEIEKLSSYPSHSRKNLYFEPFARLYAEVGKAVIEADRLGNDSLSDIESIVNSSDSDLNWENYL